MLLLFMVNRDSKIGEVEVEYQNYNENTKRRTSRGIQKIAPARCELNKLPPGSSCYIHFVDGNYILIITSFLFLGNKMSHFFFDFLIF